HACLPAPHLPRLASHAYNEGERAAIWTLKDEHREDGSPYMELVAAVHDDRAMLPDDYRYEWTVQSLERIAETDDPEEAAYEIEADVYTADLVRWLGSHARRPGYVDEATSELGHSELGIMGDVMAGQALEKQEVYRAVLAFLGERVNFQS
ncbi:MAG: hypothetical protein LC740_16095, partial [Actinobacteria bacterium]|nr:hypothetical protein [Actinomycetota bacterium]